MYRELTYNDLRAPSVTRRCGWEIIRWYIRLTSSHLFLASFFFAKVTARFTTLSFNRPVTGGFNLRSQSAGSLDSISLQADTLLDVLHEHTTVHLYGSGTCTHRRAVCTNSMSPLEFRQHVGMYFNVYIHVRYLRSNICTAKCICTRKCELSYMDACMRAYSQVLSLILHI